MKTRFSAEKHRRIGQAHLSDVRNN